MDANAITWMIGLTIGVLFGWFWGYAAGQRSVVIPLPAETGDSDDRAHQT